MTEPASLDQLATSVIATPTDRNFGELLARFPERTGVFMALCAADLLLPEWAWAADRIASKSPPHRVPRFERNAPLQAYRVVWMWLAGYALTDEHLGSAGAVFWATNDVPQSGPPIDHNKTERITSGISNLEILIHALVGHDSGWLAKAVTGLATAIDDRTRVLPVEWWAACTRRLAFADVFTAEIELGEPPEPWPGDDPGHLARVAAWEAMGDDERQAATERHHHRHDDDTLELRCSSRVIGRA